MTITLLILASLVVHGAATADAKPSVLRTSWSRANLVDTLERKIEGLKTSGRSLAATLQLRRHIEPVFGQEKCEACLLYYRSRLRADGTPVERFRDCINLALATCGEEQWGDCDALDAFVRQLDGDGTVSQAEAQQGAEALLNHIERDLLPKCANQDMCQPCGVVLDWLDTSGRSSMDELVAVLSAWQDCVYVARGYCDEPLEVENLECSDLDLVDQFLQTFRFSGQEVEDAVESLLQWADTHVRFGCQLREGPLEGVGTRECQGWDGFLARNFASRQSAALPRALGGLGWLCTDPEWTVWPPAPGDCFTFFQFYQEMGISTAGVPEPDALGPAQQRPSACPEAAQLPSSVQITCMEDVSVLHCDPPCSLQDAESNRFLYRVRNLTFDLVPGEIWKTFSVDGLQSMGAAADCRGQVLLWGSDPAFSVRSFPTAPKCEYQLLGSISYLDSGAPRSFGPESIYELPEWRSCLRDDCKNIYERGAWTCALTAVDSPVSSALLPRQPPQLDPASSATLPALSISSNGR